MTVKLSDFTQDQLQLMLNLTVVELDEIRKWKDAVDKYGLHDTLNELWEEKCKKQDNLNTIITQVLNAMGDVKLKETIMSN